MRKLARLAFWLYAIVLFTATHWPNLRIESNLVDRPDILIHMAAFGLWTALLIATGYLAPGASEPLAESRGVRGWLHIVTRPRAIVLVILTALVYAAIDEASQGVPGLGRTVAWDDYGANSAGIVAAGAAAVMSSRFLRRETSAGRF